MNEEEVSIEDVLFLALTRPTYYFGVPLFGLVFNMFGSMTIGALLGIGSSLIPVYIIILIVPTHLVMRIMTRADPNCFRTKYLWLITKGQSATTEQWGGSSMHPLSSDWALQPEELPISV